MRAGEKSREMWMPGLALVLIACLVPAICASAHAFPQGLAASYAYRVGLKSDGTMAGVGWNGSGQLNVATWKPGQKEKMFGVFDNGVWYLDLSGNGMWDGTFTDGLYYLGVV